MNQVLRFLSKSQIRFLGGKYVCEQTITLPDGKQQEILVYTGDRCLFSGQCTLFRTIIIKDSVLLNTNRFNYIFTHEMAHKNQWWGVFFYPLVLLILISIFTLGASFSFLIQAILSLNLLLLANSVITLLLTVVLFLIPWAFSWIMELNADFKAINVIGLQIYLNIMNVLPKSKPTFLQKMIIRLTHPPSRLTVYLWKRLHA